MTRSRAWRLACDRRSRSLLRSRVALRAQGLDPAALLNPPADSWPTYHGDYSGQRHSRLTQITPDNVHQLTLAWAFQTGPDAADQGDADPGQRRDLRDDARQPLGDRRAHRRASSGATRIRPTRASTSAIAAPPSTRTPST